MQKGLILSLSTGGGLDKKQRIFNTKAFINLSDYKSVDEMIEFVKYLDNDEKAYLTMLNEPLILDFTHKEKEDEKLAYFLSHIFIQDENSAYRRGFGQWRMNLERRYKKYQKIRELGIKMTKIYRQIICLEFFKKLTAKPRE